MRGNPDCSIPTVAGVAPLYDDSDVDAVACRALWCALIWDQWKIAMSPDDQFLKATEVCNARRWFGSKDFYIVCALAGIDAEYVMDRFDRIKPAKGVRKNPTPMHFSPRGFGPKRGMLGMNS